MSDEPMSKSRMKRIAAQQTDRLEAIRKQLAQRRDTAPPFSTDWLLRVVDAADEKLAKTLQLVLDATPDAAFSGNIRQALAKYWKVRRG